MTPADHSRYRLVSVKELQIFRTAVVSQTTFGLLCAALLLHNRFNHTSHQRSFHVCPRMMDVSSVALVLHTAYAIILLIILCKAMLDFAAVHRCCGLWARYPWPKAVFTGPVFWCFLVYESASFAMLRRTALEPHSSSSLPGS